MNGAEKVSSGFVLAGRDAPVLLEPCEEDLKQMASLVQMSVAVVLVFARGARWNHESRTRCLRLATGLEDAFPDPRLAASRMAQRHHPKIAETRVQVSPRNACPVPVQHRLDE